jgi:hypothetical protein
MGVLVTMNRIAGPEERQTEAAFLTATCSLADWQELQVRRQRTALSGARSALLAVMRGSAGQSRIRPVRL